MVDSASDVKFDVALHITRKFNELVGHFQNTTINKTLKREPWVRDKFEFLVKKDNNLGGRSVTPEPNLLQVMLNGNLQVFENPYDNSWIRNGVTYKSNTLPYYVISAMSLAVSYVAAEKWGLDEQNKLAVDLSPKIIDSGNALAKSLLSKVVVRQKEYNEKDLPEQERRFFEALNKVIRLTKKTPNVLDHLVFDHNFRLSFYANMDLSSIETSTQLKNFFGQNVPDPTTVSQELMPKLIHTKKTANDAAILKLMEQDLKNDVLQKNVFRSLYRFVMQHISGFEQFSLSESSFLKGENHSEIVKRLREVLGQDAIKTYTEETLLLEPFASGKVNFSSFVSATPTSVLNEYFSVVHPPLGKFMMEAIRSTALDIAKQNNCDDGNLTNALNDLDKAYQDVVSVQQEKEAQRLAKEAQTILAEQEQGRQKELERIEHQPYHIPKTDRMGSLKTRASSNNHLDRERLKNVLQDIELLAQLLNMNVPAHVELGDCLFKDNESATLRVLDSICTGANLKKYDANRDKTRAALVTVLANSLENLAPQFENSDLRKKFIESNTAKHSQLINVLINSPMLLIAAVGDSNAITYARFEQDSIFRKKGKDKTFQQDLIQWRISQLAIEALKSAFVKEEKAIPEDIATFITTSLNQEPPTAPEVRIKPAFQTTKTTSVKPPSATDTNTLPTVKIMEISPSFPFSAEVTTVALGTDVSALPDASSDVYNPLYNLATLLPQPVNSSDTKITNDPAADPTKPQSDTSKDDTKRGLSTLPKVRGNGNGHKNGSGNGNGNGQTLGWDDVRIKAEQFIHDNPYYNILRHSLGLSQGYPIRLTLSRGNGGKGNEKSISINQHQASPGHACEMKDQLIRHLFNTQPIVEYVPRRNEGTHASAYDEYLPSVRPTAAYSKERGVHCLKLTFEQKDPETNKTYKTITTLTLGVQQNKSNFEEAQRRGQMMLDHLDEILSSRPEGSLESQVDRLLKRLQSKMEHVDQHKKEMLETLNEVLKDKNGFPIKELKDLDPTTLATVIASKYEKYDNKLEAFLIDVQNSEKELSDNNPLKKETTQRHTTAQDLHLWLQNKIAQEEKAWKQAELLKLEEYTTEDLFTTVDFPSKEAKSFLLIEYPKQTGTPTPSWVVPIVICEGSLFGKQIVETTINTHVLNPKMAAERALKIMYHIKAKLEEHACSPNGADWHRKEVKGVRGHLDRFSNAAEAASNNNIDWTKLHKITDQLGYMHEIKVRASEPVDMENGRSSFTLSLQRKDGSFHLESSGEPYQRKITIDTKSIKIINTLRDSVENNCQRLISELKAYNPYAVLHRFDVACESTMKDVVAKTVGAELTPRLPAQSQAANGDSEYRPGDRKSHHAPTDEQHLALSGFAKYIRPRYAHREL